MAGLREIRARARADLHKAMRVPTLYYPEGPEGPSEIVWCRVHAKTVETGDRTGTSLGAAERIEGPPQIVFWAADAHTPARGNIYIASPGEGYQIETVEPRDGETITARCERMPTHKAVLYEAPEDDG